MDRFVLFACVAATIAVAVEAGDAPLADAKAKLSELSRRLQAGDRTAIDDLLARTQPASSDLAAASARAESLRAEVERLRGVQLPRLVPSRSAEPVADNQPTYTSLEPLREARAWLYAGEPARALGVLPDVEGEPAYWRGRALEKLGRDKEALEAYRRAASASDSAAPSTTTWKAWAAADAAHLEWKARVAPGTVKP